MVPCYLYTYNIESGGWLYSGTSLYRLPMGRELLAVIERWLLYRDGTHYTSCLWAGELVAVIERCLLYRDGTRYTSCLWGRELVAAL